MLDVQYPYAEDAARLQVLYRLPAARGARSLLLVSSAEPSGLPDWLIGWSGGVTAVSVQQACAMATATTGPRFDVVALPDVLAAHAVPVDASTLLRAAQQLLTPDGVVVGHQCHALALRRMFGRQWLLAALRAATGRPDVGSATGCTRALAQAGLLKAECFYVQPNIDSPLGLVPVEWRASRAYFMRAVRSAQGSFTQAGYLARLAVAALGLGGMFQQHLFFWARRSC